MRSQIDAAGLSDDVDVESAGTANYHVGGSPDSRSVAAAAARGIEVSGRARQAGADDLEDFDLVIAMDRSNREDLLSLARTDEQRERIRLLREFDPDAAPGDLDVPDPYYGGEDGFEEVLDIVERSCRGLLAEVESRIGA